MKMLALKVLLLVATIGFGQTQETFKERANKNLPFLIKEDHLKGKVLLDQYGVRIYPTSHHQGGTPELFLKWGECPMFVDRLENLEYASLLKFYKAKSTNTLIDHEGKYRYKFIPYKPYPSEFRDLYVAIDPGHYAGTWEEAIAEDRYVKVKGSDVGVKGDVKFFEGDLAGATAYIVRKKLQELGVTVILTREPGKSSLGLTFDEWYKTRLVKDLDSCLKVGFISREEYNTYRYRSTKAEVQQKFFSNLDFRTRANIINKFQPNVTLVMHYNASELGVRDVNGYLKPVDENFNMAFVAGAFMDGELAKQDARIDFVRLLLSPDFDNSSRLAHHILNAHEKILKVPTLPRENGLTYLPVKCVATEYPGVYTRNLALLRIIRGPIVYLESLIQDNKEEILKLSKKDYTIDGITTSSRCAEVADAYVLGFTSFFEENKQIKERLFSSN